MSSNSSQRPLRFGPFDVAEQVFYTTPHSFALVNLKPLLPGHVLVCPTKPHKRLTDLPAPELTDLFQAVQCVQRMLARYYFSSPPSGTRKAPPEAGSFNIALQDGPEAGQTVPHVHVHVIPRIRGATAKAGEQGEEGDELYEKMADERGNVGGALWDRQMGERPAPGGGFPSIEDANREARKMEEMVQEAETYRAVLREMDEEEETKGGQGRGDRE